MPPNGSIPAPDQSPLAPAPASVRVTDQGAVRVIEIASPARRNALTRDLLAGLVRALPAARPGPSQPIRCVVLTGAAEGRAFSAGFDLSQVDAEERRRGFDPIGEAASAIESAQVPVLAAIDGPCYGGALELAAACSVRIAGPTAKLCLPPARLGLAYSRTGLARLLRLLPKGQLLRLAMTADAIDASEALRIGLVCVLANGGARAHALDLARKIAGNAPLAIYAMRRTIAALTEAAPLADEAIAALDGLRQRTVDSADLAEGVLAFRERRTARFEGR